MKRILICALILAATSCKERDQLYCKTSADCKTAERPLCDLTGANPDSEGLANTCVSANLDGGVPADAFVPCTKASCTGSAPVCEESTGVCRPCTGDVASECPSMLCDEDRGECVDSSLVTYVSLTGNDSTSCGSQANPCRTITQALSLTPERKLIRILAGRYDEAFVVEHRSIHLVGSGTTISGLQTPGMPAFRVGDEGILELEGITISDVIDSPPGPAPFAVVCNGPAMRAKVVMRRASVRENRRGGLDISACDLSMRDSAVVSNLGLGPAEIFNQSILCRNGTVDLLDTRLANSGTGIDGLGCSVRAERVEIRDHAFTGIALDGNSKLDLSRSLITRNRSGVMVAQSDFSIINNFVVENRSTDPGTGGVRFYGSPPSGTGLFAFNTVAGNTSAASGIASGVLCQNALPAPFQGNIVFGNTGGAGNTSPECTFTHSVVGGIAPGNNNLADDPRFVDMTNGNFHLQGNSPARNRGPTAGAPPVDFDGDPRPSDGQFDIGADETSP